MNKESVLNIGFDDTDSPTGMCTTFLAYKIVDLLQKQKTEFVYFYPSKTQPFLSI